MKNANSGDKVDVNKEYAPLMKKYMERTQHAKALTEAHGGIKNTKISDGLNFTELAESGAPGKRPRYGAQ